MEGIKKDLLSAEGSKFSKVSNTPPNSCVDTSLSHSSSNFVSETTETEPVILSTQDTPLSHSTSSFVSKTTDIEPVMLSTQDMELLEILKKLENNANANFTGCEHKYNTDDSRMKGHFRSDTVFNLSKKDLTKDEIKFLAKGLDFAPIQRKVNGPKPRQDFESFCRCMRIKWHIRNETSDNFSEIPAFSPKSSWKP